MRIKILLALLFSGYLASAQTASPVIVKQSSETLIQQYPRLSVLYGLKIPVYSDTTTANTWIGKDSIGLIIKVIGGSVYIRDTSDGTHKWSPIVGASGAVNTVFGRDGDVVATEADYSSFYPLLSGTYADPSWIANLSAAKIAGAGNVTAGSSKIVLGGIPSGAGLQNFSIDVNQANFALSSIGGLLNLNQINASGTYNDSNVLYENGTWGRIPATSGSTTIPNTNIGTGYRWVIPGTGNIKTHFVAGYLKDDSTTNANGITTSLDTSAGKAATQTMLNAFVPALTSTQIGIGNGSNLLSGSSALTYDGSKLIVGSWAFKTANIAGYQAITKTTNLATSVPGGGTTIYGYGAGNPSMTGSNNALFGGTPGLALTSGASNSVVGADAFVGGTTAGKNVIFGDLAGKLITTGSSNILAGYSSGSHLNTTSSNNILIGTDSLSSNTVATNFTFIGNGYKAYRTNVADFGGKYQVMTFGGGGMSTAAYTALGTTPTIGDMYLNTDSGTYVVYTNASVWVKWGGTGGGGSADSSTFATHHYIDSLVAADTTYFANGLTFSGDSAVLGGTLDRDTHFSGSNAKNIYFDSTKIYATGPAFTTIQSLDTTGRKQLVWNTSTHQFETMHWQVPGGSVSGLTNSNLSGSAGITNANLATMANNTVKGNVSGSSAVPSDLTGTQVTGILDKASSSTFGVVKVDGTTITASGGVLSAVGATYTADESTLHAASNVFSLKSISSVLTPGKNISFTGAGTPASPFSVVGFSTLTDPIYADTTFSNVHRTYTYNLTGSNYIASPTLTDVWYGDSWTWGAGATYPYQKFASIVSRMDNAILDDRGISGTKLTRSVVGDSSFSDRLYTVPVYDSTKYHFLFIQYGTNESLADTTAFKATYKTCLDTVTINRGWPKNRIILLSNGFYIASGADTVKIRLATNHFAQSYGVRYVDMYMAEVKHSVPYTNIQYDSLHPNPFGHQLISQAIMDTLINAGTQLRGEQVVYGDAYYKGVAAFYGATDTVTGVMLNRPALKNTVWQKFYQGNTGTGGDWNGLRFMSYPGNTQVDSFDLRTTLIGGFGMSFDLVHNGTNIMTVSGSTNVWKFNGGSFDSNPIFGFNGNVETKGTMNLTPATNSTPTIRVNGHSTSTIGDYWGLSMNGGYQSSTDIYNFYMKYGASHHDYATIENKNGAIVTLNSPDVTSIPWTFNLPGITYAAGTTSLAPFIMTSGTNTTTPVNGAFEYNGTNLFFTRASAIRENVLTTGSVNTVSPTSPDRTITVVINGTTYYIAAKTTND